MSKLTAEECATKHANRLINAVTDGSMQKGIESVKEAPTKLAAAKKDKMLQNLTKSVQDGSWERGLQRVTLEEWRTKTIEIGLPRVSSGVNASVPKTTAFYGELLPYQDKIKEELKSKPDLTLQDNVNRMVHFVTRMAQFKRTK